MMIIAQLKQMPKMEDNRRCLKVGKNPSLFFSHLPSPHSTYVLR